MNSLLLRSMDHISSKVEISVKKKNTSCQNKLLFIIIVLSLYAYDFNCFDSFSICSTLNIDLSKMSNKCIKEEIDFNHALLKSSSHYSHSWKTCNSWYKFTFTSLIQLCTILYETPPLIIKPNYLFSDCVIEFSLYGKP